MTAREFAIDVVRKLQAAGFVALWACGCVRDELLGLVPADYDVASDARPEQVKVLFRRCVEIGAAFGVIEVIGPRGDDGEWLKVQVATFRTDGTYSDGRRPDSVAFCSPEEDAKRRDFTINGMFFDPVSQTVFDYVDGQNDLANKILRAIGNATDRFAEDKLRVLRAVRMATRFDLHLDPETRAAGQAMAPQIRAVSPERIADELRKLLVHPRRARGGELLRDFGLLEPIFPELLPTYDADQRVLAALPSACSFPLAFATMLRSVGVRTARAIGIRLKFSNDELARIVWLVGHREALLEAVTMPNHQRQPLLIHDGIDELLALHRAEALATNAGIAHVEFCERVLRDTPPELLNPLPLLTGDDLIALGWPPGKLFKIVLETVRNRQLDGELMTSDEAMSVANAIKQAGR